MYLKVVDAVISTSGYIASDGTNPYKECSTQNVYLLPTYIWSGRLSRSIKCKGFVG